MNDSHLEKLGYDEFFRRAGVNVLREGFSPARVTEVNRNRYIVSDGNHEMQAELSGKFLYNTENPSDFPTVGDWVLIQSLNDDTLAIMHSFLPRKTLLKRKEPGKRIEFQLIAANIDFGLIMQSADHLNVNLLDRYLVMLNECNIRSIIIISKIDLVSPSEITALKDTLVTLNDRCLFISNTAEDGTDSLSSILVPGCTYCLLGPSGVGKSSLLNRLLGTCHFEVSTVREKDGRGRHTSVRRQLVRLDSGSIFIDTPGMRELGNFEVDQGLAETFDDFSAFSQRCRFADCSHTHEEGCAVRAAAENGEIEEGRYRNFLKLRKESEFYDMSYREKRRKDKAFGKMIRNYKKSTQRRTG